MQRSLFKHATKVAKLCLWYCIMGTYHHDLTCHLPEGNGSEFIECVPLPSDVQSFHYTDDILMVVIFVTYCYVTDYHKFGSLKHHTFIIAVSKGQELRHGLIGSST